MSGLLWDALDPRDEEAEIVERLSETEEDRAVRCGFWWPIPLDSDAAPVVVADRAAWQRFKDGTM